MEGKKTVLNTSKTRKEVACSSFLHLLFPHESGPVFHFTGFAQTPPEPPPSTTATFWTEY